MSPDPVKMSSSSSSARQQQQQDRSEVASFYRQRSVFITGGTGFIGKVLVEKLLRSCPEVKKIYLLIRTHKNEPPHERLKSFVKSDIFNVIRETNPEFHQKLAVIPGDMLSDGLGISDEDVALLALEVSVIFHAAATVKFDEALRLSVDLNVVGTKRLIALCRRMSNIDAIVHVSTAYANCDRALIAEHVYAPPAEPDHLVAALQGQHCKLTTQTVEALTPQLIRGTSATISRLSSGSPDGSTKRSSGDSAAATGDNNSSSPNGMRTCVARPTFPGQRPNTYTYTKALAEYVLLSEAHGLPVSIARPSIVGAAWKEPVPGWVDNYNGPSGLFLAMGTGVLRHMRGDMRAIADIIPVDIAVNMLICIAVRTAKQKQAGEHHDDVTVYNCTTGSSGNPITWGDVHTYTVGAWTKNPSERLFRPPSPLFHMNERTHRFYVWIDHLLPAHLIDMYHRFTGRRPRMISAYDKLHRAMSTLDYFTQNQWIFTQDNIASLRDAQPRIDRERFDIDVRSLDWRTYMEDYCLGIKRFVCREDLVRLPIARKNLQWRVTLMRRIRWGIAIVLAALALSRLYPRRKRRGGAATPTASASMSDNSSSQARALVAKKPTSLPVALFGKALWQLLQLLLRLLKLVVWLSSCAVMPRSAR